MVGRPNYDLENVNSDYARVLHGSITHIIFPDAWEIDELYNIIFL